MTRRRIADMIVPVPRMVGVNVPRQRMSVPPASG
jgi:hypothetical protein